MFGSNHIIEGESIQELSQKSWDLIGSHGTEIDTEKGRMKIFNHVSFVLSNPKNINGRFPHWDEDSEDWYLSHFVNLSITPEQTNHKYIFPYTYAWRTRAHDDGWGYAVTLVNVLQALNYGDLPFDREEDILQLIRETYHAVHPDVVLAVMAWLKRENLILFLINNKIPQEILKSTRKDLLAIIIQQLIKTPTSNKAVTPSLSYSNIDTYGILEHTPAFQNYQVIIRFNEQLNPIGFESYRMHRSLEAGPSLQLDFAHDLEWGEFIAEKIGLPHLKSTINTNQLFLVPEAEKHLETITIKEALLLATGGYEPKNYNLEPYISTPKFKNKVTQTLKLFNTTNE